MLMGTPLSSFVSQQKWNWMKLITFVVSLAMPLLLLYWNCSLSFCTDVTLPWAVCICHSSYCQSNITTSPLREHPPPLLLFEIIIILYYSLPEHLREGIRVRAEGTAHHNWNVIPHHVRLLIGPDGHGQRANYRQQPNHDGREDGQRLCL